MTARAPSISPGASKAIHRLPRLSQFSLLRLTLASSGVQSRSAAAATNVGRFRWSIPSDRAKSPNIAYGKAAHGAGDAKIRAAKPRATIPKLSDGNGLQVWITPARGKHWKLAYRYGQPCAGRRRLREIECGSHLFLYRLEFRCRSSSWARQVDDFLEDAARLAAHHNDPVRQGHRLVDVVCDQDQSEAGLLPRAPR